MAPKSLPDFIEYNGKRIPIAEFALVQCQTKEDLHNWIVFHLGIDFPDYTCDVFSSSNPMDMIWWIYQKCVLEKEEKVGSKALFVAPRAGFKTLGLSVAELASILHGNRDVAHIGAIDAQAKRCYQYFIRYLYGAPFKSMIASNPTMEKTTFKDGFIQEKSVAGRSIEILPCTLASVNGPHTSLVCLDEIDTVRDFQAYRDIRGIPSKTLDGRPPVEVGISTRKSSFGLVQQEMDNAKDSKTDVFIWSIIDLTKRCPDERSTTTKIDIYVNGDTLESIPESEYKLRPVTEQMKFEKRQGYEGCLKNCKMFAACLGNLKKQKSTSKLLHDIEYTQKKIVSNPVDWTLAQLLCRKPSVDGLIYPRYNELDHIKTYNQMWEIFAGESHPVILTLEKIIEEFNKRGVNFVLGVDFGDQLAAALLIALDGKDRAYVLAERTFTGTDDAELAQLLWNQWGTYGIGLVYPDPADPSGVRLLKKAGFSCSSKVDKDILGGISTVRSFLRIPTTNVPRMFIHESCSNLRWELPRLHKKKLPNGLLSDDPEDGNDHSADALRYPLHTIYGAKPVMMSTALIPDPKTQASDSEKKFLKVPTAVELAQELGVSFVDNRDTIGKKPDGNNDGGKSGGSGGFSWSFGWFFAVVLAGLML